MNIWVVTIKLFIEVLGKPKKIGKKSWDESPHITTITSYAPLVNLLSTILTLQLPTQKQLNDCLFSTSGVTGVDQILNTVKANVLTCLIRTMEYMFVGKSSLDPQINKFYAFIREDGITGVLKSVFNYCENPLVNLEDISQVNYILNCKRFKVNRIQSCKRISLKA